MPEAGTVYMICYTSDQSYTFTDSKFNSNNIQRRTWREEDAKHTSWKLIKGNVSVRSRSILQRAEKFPPAKVDKNIKPK
jgi:hypothetical protein